MSPTAPGTHERATVTRADNQLVMAGHEAMLAQWFHRPLKRADVELARQWFDRRSAVRAFPHAVWDAILAGQPGDDVYLPGALRSLLDALEAAPGAQWIAGGVIGFGTPEAPNHEWHLPTVPRGMLDLLSARFRMAQPGHVWSRALVQQVGGFDESLRYLFDINLYAALIARLDSLYATKPDSASLERGRAEAGVWARGQLLGPVGAQFRSFRLGTLPERPINNARLIGATLYRTRLDLFDRWFDRHDRDVRESVRGLEQLVRGAEGDSAFVRLQAAVGDSSGPLSPRTQ